jgi:hypothetical protein
MNPIRICYLLLDSVLCGRIVDAWHQEEDLVDIRLHSKYLLHKICMRANDSFFREGKSAIIVDRSQMWMLLIDKPSGYYLQRKRLRRDNILFPRKPVEPVMRTLLPLKYPIVHHRISLLLFDDELPVCENKNTKINIK